jgi:PAS domain S-box-containing protein
VKENIIGDHLEHRSARGCSRKCLLACLSAALVLAMLGIVGWTLDDGRKAARRAAEQETGNIALTLEGNIGRAVTTLDLSLRTAVRGMAAPGLAGMPPDVRQAILFDGTLEMANLGPIVIVDAGGRAIYQSRGDAGQSADLSDRPFFQDLRQRTEPGLLIAGPVASGIDGQASLLLARRISRPDGSFAGLAIAALRLSYFDQLFRSLDLGKLGIVSVFGIDGQLIARRPMVLGVKAPSPGIRELFSHSPPAFGSFERTSVLDGVRRLYSYRLVGDLPLVVSVGFSTAEIYAEWAERTTILGSVLLLLLLAEGLLAWSLWRQMQRRERIEAAAAASARDHVLALAPLKTMFAHTADSMLIAHVRANGDVAYEATNPVWERLTGVARSSAIGRTPEECLPARLAADTLADWHECLRLRRAHRVTFRSVPPGIERDWEAVIVPVFDDRGEIHRLVSIGRDVTERNTLEANLRQAHRAEAVGQLTAGVAHDFNNLLQAITAAVDMLGEQPGLTAEGRECAAVAADAARRGAALVHRLLAFSRKQTLNPSVLQPARVLAEITPLLVRVLGMGIQVETRIDAAWPVCADGDQLGDCLLNLALNARDAMPDGGVVRLAVDAAAADEVAAAGLAAGDYTRFAVADEGVGMSPETLGRALEPFFTTKPIGEGTGLGLPMVQGFARQSGGDVRIESVPGRGTTVTLWLPRSTEPNALASEPAQSADHGHGRVVVVVDDEAFVRQMLEMFLARAGYIPIALASGDAALELLQAGEACDLLITDQSMPGLTGSELIREVASFRPVLPAMLITGFDKVRGLEDLPTHVTVLQKPFGRMVFLQQIQALLGTSLQPEGQLLEWD